MDTKEDDGRISLELEPNKKPTSKKEAGMCFLQCRFSLTGDFIDAVLAKPVDDPNKSQ